MAAISSKRPRCEGQPRNDALEKRCAAVAEELTSIGKELEMRMQLVQEREDKLARAGLKMEQNAAAAKDRIKLDVGGRIFSTSKNTLLKREGTYFHALLCSGKWEPEDGDAYFIDRDPRFFDRVMASLRTCAPVDMSGLQPSDAKALKSEMQYYMLDTEDIVTEVRWDNARRSPNLAVSQDGRTVTKQAGGDNWDTAVLAAGESVESFQVRVDGRDSCNPAAMVGYMLANEFKPDRGNFNSGRGWFLFTLNAKIYARPGEGIASGLPIVRGGDRIKCSFDKNSRLISFQINEDERKYTWLVEDDGPIAPCIELLYQGSSITLVD